MGIFLGLPRDIWNIGGRKKLDNETVMKVEKPAYVISGPALKQKELIIDDQISLSLAQCTAKESCEYLG